MTGQRSIDRDTVRGFITDLGFDPARVVGIEVGSRAVVVEEMAAEACGHCAERHTYTHRLGVHG